MNISNSSKRGILKSILLITGIFLYSQGYSQLKLPTSALQVSAGYSRHGSGDFEGIIFGTEYIKYYSEKTFIELQHQGNYKRWTGDHSGTQYNFRYPY